MSVLTNNFDGCTFVRQQQNLLSGLNPCITRRPARRLSAFFIAIFSYGRDMQAPSGGGDLVAVGSTCMFPATKIEPLFPGLTRTQGTKPMAKDTTNPILVTDELGKLGDARYDLERLISISSQLIEYAENEGHALEPKDMSFLVRQMWNQQDKIQQGERKLQEELWAEHIHKDIIKGQLSNGGTAA